MKLIDVILIELLIVSIFSCISNHLLWERNISFELKGIRDWCSISLERIWQDRKQIVCEAEKFLESIITTRL